MGVGPKPHEFCEWGWALNHTLCQSAVATEKCHREARLIAGMFFAQCSLVFSFLRCALFPSCGSTHKCLRKAGSCCREPVVGQKRDVAKASFVEFSPQLSEAVR